VVVNGGNNCVNLSWEEPEGAYPLGYRVYRDGVAIPSIFPMFSFCDNAVQNGNQYTYAVSAVYAEGAEVLSEPFDVILYVLRPPVNLSATFSDGLSIVLNWESPSSTEGLLHYKVYRGRVGGPNMAFLSTAVAETFVDSDLLDGVIHYYRVTAVYTNGESFYSNQAYDTPYLSGSDEVTVVFATALHGNYPNPFNPETVISFSLGCSGAVSIDIYNVRGQKVRSLISGVYGAGVHSVVWNGADSAGRSVGSGVYFYRMVSGEYVGVRKMLLLK